MSALIDGEPVFTLDLPDRSDRPVVQIVDATLSAGVFFLLQFVEVSLGVHIAHCYVVAAATGQRLAPDDAVVLAAPFASALSTRVKLLGWWWIETGPTGVGSSERGVFWFCGGALPH